MTAQLPKVDTNLPPAFHRACSFASALTLLALACSSPPAPRSLPPQPPTPFVEPTPANPPIAAFEPPRAVAVAIAPEIRGACGIAEPVAYFEYDSANLDDRGSRVLDSVAVCFVSGPLAGRSVSVVGHADPRGEFEYNLVLGGTRASRVKTHLVAQGLGEERVEATSRGEAEARGTDELSWAEDRRVDLRLGI
jgi:peptidoglycan-associated lipoprotein